MRGHGRGRCQLCLTALVIVWLAALITVPPVRAQNADPLSLDVSNCPTPAATPACATMAYSKCLWLNKPSLCAAVGADDLIIWDGPLDTMADLAAVPGEYIGRLGQRIPVVRNMVEGPNVLGRLDADGVPLLGMDKYATPSQRILAVRRVFRERFHLDTDLQAYVPDRFFGSHEVLVGPEFVRSIFFRLEGARWVITSFASIGMDCLVVGEADYYYRYLWRCQRSPAILGWSDYYPSRLWPE